MITFYTYLWLREDGTPYYVGKGTGNRAYTSSGHGVNRPKGTERIIIFPAESEEDAFKDEMALIWYYGRKDNGTGCLRNLTDGGEDPPKKSFKGHKHSKESIRIISESKKGRVHSEETRRKMSETHRKRYSVLSAESRRSKSEKMKGNKNALGLKHSEETRCKIGEARRKAVRETQKCQLHWDT